MTVTALDPIEGLTTITDPEARAKAAQAFMLTLDRRIAPHRLNRNVAMLHLLGQGWPKTRVCKEVGVSRTMFREVVEHAPQALPRVANPESTARREHSKVRDMEEQRVRANEVRDEAILILMFDNGWKNADIAKAVGIHPVRVAQMRRNALPTSGPGSRTW